MCLKSVKWKHRLKLAILPSDYVQAAFLIEKKYLHGKRKEMELDMEFFNRAVEVLEAIVEAMGTTSKNNYLYPDTKYRVMTVKYPEFTKKMVRVKKHIRPPVRAGPVIRFYPKSF